MALSERREYAQVNDADFRRRLDAVPGLGSEAHDPWTRIVDVDLGVAGVDGRERNTVPPAQFDKVLDGRNSNLRLVLESACRRLAMLLTPRIAGCREKNTMRPVGASAICMQVSITPRTGIEKTDLANSQYIIDVEALE